MVRWMEISIKDFLSLGFLNEYKILSGKEGLNNVASSINVIDKPDSYKWNQEGSLLLLREKLLIEDEDVGIDIIKNLAEAGIAAILMLSKVDSLDLSESLINVSNEYKLPIISFLPTKRFVEYIQYFDNNIYCDGTKEGYDLELTRTVSDAVDIPVIASGGAGKLEHLRDVLTKRFNEKR